MDGHETGIPRRSNLLPLTLPWSSGMNFSICQILYVLWPQTCKIHDFPLQRFSLSPHPSPLSLAWMSLSLSLWSVCLSLCLCKCCAASSVFVCGDSPVVFPKLSVVRGGCETIWWRLKLLDVLLDPYSRYFCHQKRVYCDVSVDLVFFTVRGTPPLLTHEMLFL